MDDDRSPKQPALAQRLRRIARIVLGILPIYVVLAYYHGAKLMLHDLAELARPLSFGNA